MFFRHPSKRALQEWLEQGTTSASIDDHLSDCRRCSGILEELEDLDEATLGQALGPALAVAFASPDNLSERLERKVSARLDSRVVLTVVSDLFGAGLDTTKLLLLEDPTDE